MKLSDLLFLISMCLLGISILIYFVDFFLSNSDKISQFFISIPPLALVITIGLCLSLICLIFGALAEGKEK
jgi:hypothetical protein